MRKHPVAPAQLRVPGRGRRDDERLSSSLIRRGRPPSQVRSRARNPISLNRWITSRTVVLVRGHKAGDRWYRRPGRHDDQRSADPSRLVLPTPHDLLQRIPFLIRQSPRPCRLGHRSTPLSTAITFTVESGLDCAASGCGPYLLPMAARSAIRSATRRTARTPAHGPDRARRCALADDLQHRRPRRCTRR